MTNRRTFSCCPPTDGPTHVGQAADLVRQACHAEIGHRHESPDAFYDYGGGMTMLLGSLADLTGKLARQVQAWPDRCDLYDDTGADPAIHIARAYAALVNTSTRLTQACRVAGAYHTAIGHIGVRPDDDGDDGAGAGPAEPVSF